MKSKFNIHEKYLGQATVAEAAGCPFNTFKAWRARHGLCKDTGKWKFQTKHFSFLDVCVVHCVVRLTQNGVSVGVATMLADNQMRMTLERLLTKQEGAAPMIGFHDQPGQSQGTKFYVFGRADLLKYFDASEGLMMVVDLTKVIDHVNRALASPFPTRQQADGLNVHIA